MELFILTLLLNGEPLLRTEAHFHSIKQCEAQGASWLDWLHLNNPDIFEWNDYAFVCELAKESV